MRCLSHVLGATEHVLAEDARLQRLMVWADRRYVHDELLSPYMTRLR